MLKLPVSGLAKLLQATNIECTFIHPGSSSLWFVYLALPSPYSGLGMCNTMRVVHQISLVPEYVTLRLDYSGLARVCKALKSLFMSPRSAGRKLSVTHLHSLEKLPN